MCYYCHSHKHTINNCPKTWRGSANINSMHCGYCGSTKHNIKACPKTFSGNAKRSWYPNDVKNDFIKD